jgi:hypothetical protein
MTGNPEQEPQPTPEELAAIELRHGLASLGPDTDRALMVTLRTPSGRYIGDVWLSAQDVEALSDACVSIAAYRNCDDDAAAPLPLAEDDLTEKDVTEVITAFQQLLGNGGE